MKKTNMQKRKKRTIEFTITLIAYTDFMEKLFSEYVSAVCDGLQTFANTKGNATKISLTKTIK